MIPTLRTCVISSVAVVTSTIGALAIEPDAPARLITRNEAMVIAVRQSLDRLPQTKDAGKLADRAALAAYYSGDNAEPIWLADKTLNARARAVAEEIAKAGDWGLDPKVYALPDLSATYANQTAMIGAEIQMSLAALRYARHARGGRMDPKELSLDIDRTPPIEAPIVVLTSLKSAEDPAAYLRDLHPKHDQFVKLLAAYRTALANEKAGIQPEPTPEIKGKDRSKKRRAKRSRTKLSKRLLYNMEMWRWMPLDLGNKFIWSNIPEFKVRVVKNGRIIHQERIVTGKVTNKTPVFSDEMETIVFHPVWGVPNSIKIKEVLPSLMRGGNIMQRQNLRITYGGRPVNPHSIDWSRQDIRNFHVYQPPGSRNALGVVKFMFPNKHAVYMHDTPTKHLFKRTTRAYSHGCMRVRNPLKLAEIVLSNDKGWDRSRINALVRSGPKNNPITLDTKIPVHVTYFTARIDNAGKPVLVKDIYGHEKRIQMGLDGKAHLIVKRRVNLDEARRKVVSRSGGYSYWGSGGGGNDDWRRAIFGN